MNLVKVLHSYLNASTFFLTFDYSFTELHAEGS